MVIMARLLASLFYYYTLMIFSFDTAVYVMIITEVPFSLAK